VIQLEKHELMSVVYFYVTNQIHLLDLSGVLQVFQEAKQMGFNYTLKFIGSTPTIKSSSGLELSSLLHFSKTKPVKNDIIFVPGFDMQQHDDYSTNDPFFEWIKNANANQVSICSVCTGAFLLAKSGVLDHQECTTHWRFVHELKAGFPLLKAHDNKIYVKSNNIYTSAGVATGIDLALFLIEERHGELTALKIAKELAIYIRRNGVDEQESVFLQFRNHKDHKVHTVHDWIIHNLDKTSTLDSLADLVHTSSRNLTRIFKQQTGLSVAKYRTMLRVEKAKSLLRNSGYKLEYIAQLCGFKSSKQLRAVLEQSKLDNEE
jgi:transcriptional regulator GlxA family with amidase domain